MLSHPTRIRKNHISNDVLICLECGSDTIEQFEFAIHCEDCGSLVFRR